ncbi:MAG: GreA/GreB family elongation factor [Cyclobacteriaceae bacterium]|nr:GreA/GreB family elongation factor [Cyclobacteriaceae bacterium SS2]
MRKRVTFEDYEQLMSQRYYALLFAKIPEIVEQFYCDLMVAELIEETQTSENLVKMNSHLVVKEKQSGKLAGLKLVFPREVKDHSNISVFSPIGSALLGKMAGDHASIDFNGETKDLEILKVFPNTGSKVKIMFPRITVFEN